MIAALLANARAGLSDEDILLKLNAYSQKELAQAKSELLGRRGDIRVAFGHLNSPFIDAASSGNREYEALVRLTDLVRVAMSRKHFEARAAKTGMSRDIPTGSPLPDVSQERRIRVEAYIDEVLRVKGNRITKKDIWKTAGYKSRAEFERWESGWHEKRGRKMNKAADRAFRRILDDKPHLK